jgi:hypothetical protein
MIPLMSRLQRFAPVMAAGWPDLVAELDLWGEADRVATLWWRDDDAVAPSAELDRLVAMLGKIPVALAVIPGTVEPELAAWLCHSSRSLPSSGSAVLQHGWRHSNRSTGKKSEFPRGRSCEEVAFELASGRERLAQLFGTRALAVLVPPWNRFDDYFLPLLRDCGICAISRANPRRTASSAPGIVEVNIDIDLVAWGGDRGFIGEEEALGRLIGHLRARRLGDAYADEATGILTHHLVQDAATDAFVCCLAKVTGAHPAARWLDAFELFAPRTRARV